MVLRQIKKQLKLVLLIALINFSYAKKFYAISINNAESTYKINTTIVVTEGNSLQDAIDAASAGDTISVAPGTYTPAGRITINKEVSFIGQDEATTIIDVSGNGTDYGILVSASNVTIRNFTIKPPLGPGALGTSTGGGYAIHVSNTPSTVSNITVANITIQNGNRSGLDFNGVDTLTVSDVTSQNAAYGNGMNLTGVHEANVSNFVSGGNAWGGIAIYSSSQASRGSDNINIDGTTCTLTESNKIYSQDEFSFVNTDITITGYDYTVKNSGLSAYTWYNDNLSNAVTFANSVNSSSPGSYITQLSNSNFHVGSGMSIQSAIDAASAGNTINIAAGTYNDTLLINKRISLVGAGSDTNGTIIQSTNPPVVSGGTTYPSGYSPVIRLNASGVAGDSLVIKDLRIRPRQDLIGAAYPHPGILFALHSSIAYIKLDNVNIVGTTSIGTPEMGIVADGSTSINHFSISDCEFKDMGYGLIFFNDGNSPTSFQNFKMSNTTLQNNALKGFYTEKLSGAIFSNLTVASNGNTSRSPSWADANNTGIDITLKYGDYQNITFDNLTVSNNGVGSLNGAGIAVKARDDGSYSSSPATLSGVSITNSVFSNNTNAISFGEPGQTNTGPSAIVINSNSLTGSTSYSIVDHRGDSSDEIKAAANWWNTQESSTISSGLAGSIIYNPWWKNNYAGDSHSSAWSWGTDGNLQSSVDSLSAGDTLYVEPGVYSGNLSITKVINLFGSGNGADSTSNTILKGTITLSSGTDVSNRILLKSLRVNNNYTVHGIIANSYSTIDDVYFDGCNYGVSISGGTTDLQILNSTFDMTKIGIRLGSTATLNGLYVYNSQFNNNYVGAYFAKDSNTDTSNKAHGVVFRNCTFQSDTLKGIYAEKLEDAVLDSLTMDSCGILSSYGFNAAIDINLKAGSYSNFTLKNSTITNSGLQGSESANSLNPVAVTVKARDDGSYNAAPATLNSVTILNNNISGSLNALRFGEAGKNNDTPLNISVNKNVISASVQGLIDERRASSDTLDATGNWWGAAEGPNDNSGDGTTSYNTSTGNTVYENSDKKIAYAPWYSVSPEDNSSSAGVNQQSPKVLLVKESVPFASKGYINRGINLASQIYVDTIDVQITTITEVPEVDKNVVIKFALPPVLDSLDISSGDLTLSTDITISKGLGLTNGNIVTGGNNKVVLDTTVTNIVETPAARIIGKVEVKPRNVGTGSMQLLGLEIQSGADNLGKVGFTRKSGDEGVISVSGNSGVAMTWEISVDNQPTSGRDVKFTWLSDFDNGVDPSSVIVYRNTGSGWQYYAGPLDASGNPREVTVNVTGFSDWTVGSSNNELPVELTFFNGNFINNKVELKWATATEVNNYGFEIERNTLGSPPFEDFNNKPEEGGSIWKRIGFVNGHGNSNSPKSYLFADDKVPYGKVEYRLKQIDFDGSFEYSSIIKVNSDLINENKLNQNYPNPFNPSTNISFALPRSSNVRLEIYNVIGQLVRTLLSQNMEAGYYEVSWDSKNNSGKKAAGGIYVYRLIANDFVQTRKMMLLR